MAIQEQYLGIPEFKEPREAEHNLRLQIDGLKDFAIFMLDHVGRVATWNSGAQRFQGFESKEVIGQDFACFFTV